jgi:hypothetical protein
MPDRPYFANLSPSQLAEVSPEELGHGGFCFVVAELLARKYGSNELYRLTDRSGEMFAHIFIRVGEKTMDIHGFREIAEMRRDYSDDGATEEERVDMQRVRARFYPYYSAAQLDAVRKMLSVFIESHPERFPLPIFAAR